jgi:hypothetical protein
VTVVNADQLLAASAVVLAGEEFEGVKAEAAELAVWRQRVGATDSTTNIDPGRAAPAQEQAAGFPRVAVQTLAERL